MTKARRYRAEFLSNNIILVVDCRSKTTGLYNTDGSHRSGSCDHLTRADVSALAALVAK